MNEQERVQAAVEKLRRNLAEGASDSELMEALEERVDQMGALTTMTYIDVTTHILAGQDIRSLLAHSNVFAFALGYIAASHEDIELSTDIWGSVEDYE